MLASGHTMSITGKSALFGGEMLFVASKMSIVWLVECFAGNTGIYFSVIPEWHWNDTGVILYHSSVILMTLECHWNVWNDTGISGMLDDTGMSDDTGIPVSFCHSSVILMTLECLECWMTLECLMTLEFQCHSAIPVSFWHLDTGTSMVLWTKHFFSK